ncbi:protein DEHYDRATION-INDUCED 19 homolog 3-like [Hibiscus syriacus]|uniref:protein DEHYDRATION-INDUCED 19 homolog 3-like n=1 Tax=Hibiscus syriacus TaxID=106335 RepID=UPI001923F884|nr:protein DEHYDRATION-INDUCED 19 homolog 3-like [Hibiscus syriacus]
MVQLNNTTDEHPVEAKNGRKRKSHRSGSHSTLSLLRKELREGNLQSLLGGSCLVASSNSAPNPLLSSFILPMVDDFVGVQPHFSWETNTTEDSSEANKLERNVQLTPLSVKDQEEKTKRCKFIQGLLLSAMIFYDCLQIVCSNCRPENPRRHHVHGTEPCDLRFDMLFVVKTLMYLEAKC